MSPTLPHVSLLVLALAKTSTNSDFVNEVVFTLVKELRKPML